MQKRRQDELAPLDSPELKGGPTTPTPPISASDDEVVNAEWVRILTNDLLSGILNIINNIRDPNISNSKIAYVCGYGQTTNGIMGNILRPYPTIQSAIDAGTTGTTIIVLPGGTELDSLGFKVYTESVIVNKRVSIVGIGNVISKGYWVIPTFPAGSLDYKAFIKGIKFTNGIGLIGNKLGNLDLVIEDCTLHLVNTIKYIQSLSEDIKTLDYITNITFKRCSIDVVKFSERILDLTNPTDERGVFTSQVNEAGYYSAPCTIYLDNCTISSPDTPIFTGTGSITGRYKYMLKNNTTLTTPNPISTVTLVNTTTAIPYEVLVNDFRIVEEIKENQYGTHPAFTSQARLNEWLLKNRGTGTTPDPTPVETIEILDVVGDEPTSTGSEAKYGSATYSSGTYN